MEGLYTEDKDEGSISQYCSDVHEAEGERKPGVSILQPRDAK